MSALLLSGCGETPGDFSERSQKPLSPQLLTLMQEKGTTPSSPMLIRAFKKEAEVQVWKMRTDGHYALLKSYPICRWSGQLGPKTREGDRQVPEGFYAIGPSQMNPNSAYYLSFNVGYPNAYDRAHNYTGGSIMVHGVCSSAGCFSMTDKQIAEIYAIARESFAGGQREIQFQSYPFHMTAENFAKYRLDPNIAFWKELKVGNDNFEVTKQEVAVGVCNLHYVFNAQPANGMPLDPNGPCPALKHDETVALEVNAKEARDNAQVLRLVASGVRPVHTQYADGGQNEHFAHAQLDDVSRPDALADGPVDIPLDKGKRYKAPTAKQLAAAEAKAQAEETAVEKKAEAAHAYAYVEPPVAPEPKPQGFSFTLPGTGQKTQQAAGPQPVRVAQQGGFLGLFGGGSQNQPAAQPQASQDQGAMSATQASAQDAAANTMGPAALLSSQGPRRTQQLPAAAAAAPQPVQQPQSGGGFFGLFGGGSQNQQAAQAPQAPTEPAPPTAIQRSADDAAANTMGPAALLSGQGVRHTQPVAAAAPAPLPANEPDETGSTFTHSRPLPPTFVQSAAIRSGKPIIVTSSDPHSVPTRPAEAAESRHAKGKVKAKEAKVAEPPSQAEADAEAAKAAYAKTLSGEKASSSTASMPFGFSGFISGDK